MVSEKAKEIQKYFVIFWLSQGVTTAPPRITPVSSEHDVANDFITSFCANSLNDFIHSQQYSRDLQLWVTKDIQAIANAFSKWTY